MKNGAEIGLTVLVMTVRYTWVQEQNISPRNQKCPPYKKGKNIFSGKTVSLSEIPAGIGKFWRVSEIAHVFFSLSGQRRKPGKVHVSNEREKVKSLLQGIPPHPVETA